MAGPDQRFDQLYRDHAEAVRGYCRRRLGPDDAFDAAADVFVVVWRRLDACPRGDEARLWIYGVARNVVANRYRKRLRSRSLLERVARTAPVVDGVGPEGVVVRRVEYEQLHRALAKLPDRYREVLILAEWDGLDRDSIAELEGVSRNAIDKRISRAYARLARHMKARTQREGAVGAWEPIEERGEA